MTDAIVPADDARAKSAKVAPARALISHQVPESIRQDRALNDAIAALPKNYNFEIHKTVWRIREANAKKVALQFPEGLLMYACTISDIVEHFTGAETVVMGDVTYGACCVDDFSARALGADFMVHYGHSCLVPIDVTTLKMLYVFVDIAIDVDHLEGCVRATFTKDAKLAVMGTIQFAPAVHELHRRIASDFRHIYVPQAKPLSPGETLGCTSPKLDGVESLVFVADGRFHLESAMIMNPHLTAYRYDPFSKAFTVEEYDHDKMQRVRKEEIDRASSARKFGVILGTLGRQGNTAILNHVTSLLQRSGRSYFVLLLSEVFPQKLKLFQEVEAWVQIACPRLSIDWGAHFAKPLLSPYELEVAMGATEWRKTYPMDFYSREGGPWSNYYEEEQRRKAQRADREARKAKRRAVRQARKAGAGATPAEGVAVAAEASGASHESSRAAVPPGR